MISYITVDSGTTNTRITLVCDGNIIDTEKFSVSIKDGKEKLADALKSGISNLLFKNGIAEGDIERVLASGMITSELGLCPLAHISVPAGIEELAKNVSEIKLDDISSIPFVFVRGVKKCGESFEDFDVMRGEETEIIGILENGGEKDLYILPGSHSKLIYTDNDGRITDFSTEFTGELISALANGTILKNSVDLSIGEYDEKHLTAGYSFAKKRGINAALFKVRVLDAFCGASKVESFSFFLGAALSAEIQNIIGSDAKRVILAGKRELKNPMAELIRFDSDKEIILLDDSVTAEATVKGLVKIYEHRRKIH